MPAPEQPIYDTSEIQDRVDRYIGQFKEGYFSPLSLMARLSEETGEFAREVNHFYGEKPKKLLNSQRQWKRSLVMFFLF